MNNLCQDIFTSLYIIVLFAGFFGNLMVKRMLNRDQRSEVGGLKPGV
ncbi:hypothetical protein KsCSTR_09530 [Candidatus Kuenenia stuttgartiensis]|uniref:Uncharacterized protein n=1 Tax=Kuenenia stuttgartiensis TaxID=174633 RepID=A0A6G7GLU3_KUEST|nr:hypothetical protein KsCSTR_09530 [Candidatus Kuenenia stuttgartiensis]